MAASAHQEPASGEGSKVAKERAHWTNEDVEALCKFLFNHKAEAGDGANFTKKVWREAAQEMEKCRTKGGPKTGDSCKSKWSQIKEKYNTVHTLMNQSGFSWSLNNGVGVTANSPEALQSVWNAYIAKHPKAKEFADKGWPLYDDVSQLMPSGTKGGNVYQGSSAIQQTPIAQSRDVASGVGHAGGESSGKLNEQSGDVGGRVGDVSGDQLVGWINVTRDMDGVDMDKGEGSGNAGENLEDDDDVAPPTLPPPTPSTRSKRRFSALVGSESIDDSSGSPVPGPSSAGISGVSMSVVSQTSTRSKRGKMTGAIAFTNLGHNLSDLNGLIRMDLERKKSKDRQAEARHERERLERERLECERLEQKTKHLVMDAIIRLQEVDSDLLPDEQLILVNVFRKEPDSAQIYLGLTHAPLRKAWIQQTLTQACSKS